MNTFTYREVDRYKYEMLEKYTVPVAGLPDVDTKYITVKGGQMTIAPRYAWDGASSPAINTKNFRQGSLVHDAMYQLMREGHINRDKWRDYADRLLQRICIADGMSKFRAWYVYHTLRLFGRRATMPEKDPRGKIITITTGS